MVLAETFLPSGAKELHCVRSCIRNLLSWVTGKQLHIVRTECQSTWLKADPLCFWVNLPNHYGHQKKKKKIWTRIDCQCSEKKIQNTQEIKRMLFNWTKHDNTSKFSRKSSFSCYIQHKNIKTINSTYHVSVGCGSWQKKPTSNWHKTSWINCFSFFLLYVAWKRGLPRKICTFCPVSANQKTFF